MANERNHSIINLDIKETYNYIDIDLIDLALKHNLFPVNLRNFIVKAYFEYLIKLEIDNQLTEKFTKTRSILQSCLLALLIYNTITQVIIDKAIKIWSIFINLESTSTKVDMLNFIDDLTIKDKLDDNLQTKLKDVNNWFKQIKLNISPTKSIHTTQKEQLIENLRLKI